MKTKILLLICVLLVAACNQQTNNQSTNKEANLIEYVNPLMGTDSSFELSNGNTYPAIATPWAMNFWTTSSDSLATHYYYILGSGLADKLVQNRPAGIHPVPSIAVANTV